MAQIRMKPRRVDTAKPRQGRIVWRLGPEGEPSGDRRTVELFAGEVAVDDGVQTLFGGSRLAKAVDDTLTQLFQHIAHGRFQEVVFVLEVMMDDARRYAGPRRDPRYGGLCKTHLADRLADRLDGCVNQLATADRSHSQFRHRANSSVL